MQELIYVPPGGTVADLTGCVELKFQEPYILSTLSGVSGLDYTLISSEAAGVDGVVVQSVRAESREIPCTVYVKGDSRQEMYRNRFGLIAKLTPQREPGELHYRNDYISVKIKAYPTLPADFTERVKNYSKCDVTFIAPEPYWEGLDTYSESIAYQDDVGVEFPLCFEPDITFGVQNNTIEIMYGGTVPAPVRITISGEAPSPQITNETTGETILVSDLSLESGDNLTIYTKCGEKSVKLHRGGVISDAFHLLDMRSKFWQLQPGRNVITYKSADDNKHARVRIEYTNLYSGV